MTSGRVAPLVAEVAAAGGHDDRRLPRASIGPTHPSCHAAALTRMSAAIRKFDVSAVKQSDLALVAAMAG